MYQKRTYTKAELKLKGENRILKDRIKTIKWDKRNKEKKSELNKSWRENNNNAEYLRRYRKLKKLSAVLSDYCFWDEEIFKNNIIYDNRKRTSI